MTMMDIHREALESSSPALHEFLGVYKKSIKCIYGFVEGKQDPSFYGGIFDNNLPNDVEYEIIPAGNKTEVIKLYKEFDWSRFSKHQILFFVDRDLSEILGESLPKDHNFYITDNYSIENDIVNIRTLFRVLQELMGLSFTLNQKNKIENLFEEQLSLFNNKMILIMSWIYYWRIQKSNPKLNKIKMQDLFKFEKAELKEKPNPANCASVEDYIHERAGVPYEPKEDFINAQRKFEEYNKSRNAIRGKYLIWFFVEFIFSVYSSLSSIFPKGLTVPKLHITFGPKNALILIVSKAKPPETCKKFIEDNVKNYLNHVEK